jgi:polysaccharide pyruvyl transferase CsaB
MEESRRGEGGATLSPAPGRSSSRARKRTTGAAEISVSSPPVSKSRKHVVIAGYYGYGNAGDEAILDSMLQRLRSEIQGLAPIVVTGNPEQTASAHDVEAISAKDIARIITAVEGCDLVIVGGGGLFHDYWGFDAATALTRHHSGLAFTSTFGLLATTFAKPLMLYAVGVGPLFSEISRQHARTMFNLATSATVRDPESRELVVSLGVDASRVAVTADPAFLIEPSDRAKAWALLQSEGLPSTGGPLVIVALRQWEIGAHMNQWTPHVAAALDTLVERCDARVAFMPFQRLAAEMTDDPAIAEAVRDQMRHQDRAVVLQQDYSPRDKAGMIAAADLVLGMRLHSIIFAARAQAPVIGLVYDTKVRSIMRQLSCEEYALDIGTLSAADLTGQAMTALDRHDEIAERLATATDQLIELARGDGRLVGELLMGGAAAPRVDGDSVTFVRTALPKLAAHAEKRERVIAELEAAHAWFRSEVEHRDRALAEATAAEQEQRQHEAELSERVVQQEHALAELRAINGQQEHALAGLRATLAENEREITLLERSMRALEARSALQADQLGQLQSSNSQRTEAIEGLRGEVEQRDRRLESLRGEVEQRDARLNDIYRSKMWRSWNAFWVVRRTARSVLRPVRRTRPDSSPEAAPNPSDAEPPQTTQVSGGLHAVGSLAGQAPEPRLGRFDRRQSALLSTASIAPGEQASGVSHHLIADGCRRPCRASVSPLVSVLLPVYNHADLLLGAAASVLQQTYENLELIIVDDGSTDAIEAVLTRVVHDRRVKVWRQPNQKLPRALTHASQQAKGEFVTWTSADNVMAPGAIERLVEALLANPEAVLAYADVALIDDRDDLLRDDTYRPQNLDPERPGVLRLPRDSQPLGYESDNFINACFLYRAEAARALDNWYADDLRGLEDYDFWLRLQRCGRLIHIGNDEPLYYYRVHQRSMSNELLTRERQEHLRRGELLMQHEARRRAFAERRWELLLDDGLAPEQAALLRAAAGRLPVDLVPPSAPEQEAGKRLGFAPVGADLAGPVFVVVASDVWELVWRHRQSGVRQTMAVWPGVELPTLALKARHHRATNWQIPQAGERLVIGAHLGLSQSQVDVAATRRLIAANPGLYFVILDDAEGDDADMGPALVADLENAAYLGSQAIGLPYQTYACFDAVWLPPVDSDHADAAYRAALALAYAIGRPLLTPATIRRVAAPHQIPYEPDGPAIDPAAIPAPQEIETEVLDRYLRQWRPEARLAQLLRYADAVCQDRVVPRPDFGLAAPPVHAPSRWTIPTINHDRPLRCGLVVDSLDRGGLEQVVAALARGLTRVSIDPFVLCVKSGGLIARQLQADGRRVYVADGQEATVRAILRDERPALISSHLADLSALSAAADLGIPVVETIHNTYVWFDRERWRIERQRSALFAGAIAVSDLVKEFYSRHNATLPADRISVIPNGVDVAKCRPSQRRWARQALGIAPTDVAFGCVASYDARKNQLGLLAAFERLAGSYPQAHLFCIGNVLDEHYYNCVESYRSSLRSKANIHLVDYHQDAPSLLAGFDALVLNSFFEGWSITATEALLAGTPVIHSDCGSARELVGADGERGIVVPNPAGELMGLTMEALGPVVWQPDQRNADALVAAMEQMIQAHRQWEDERERIHLYALNHFGVSPFFLKYSRRFQEIKS